MSKPTPEEVAAEREELAAWLQKLDDAHQLCTCRSDCVECRECDHDYPCDIKKLLNMLAYMTNLSAKLMKLVKLSGLMAIIQDYKDKE